MEEVLTIVDIGSDPERNVSAKNPPSGWGIRFKGPIRSCTFFGRGILFRFLIMLNLCPFFVETKLKNVKLDEKVKITQRLLFPLLLFLNKRWRGTKPFGNESARKMEGMKPSHNEPHETDREWCRREVASWRMANPSHLHLFSTLSQIRIIWLIFQTRTHQSSRCFLFPIYWWLSQFSHCRPHVSRLCRWRTQQQVIKEFHLYQCQLPQRPPPILGKKDLLFS